MSLSALLERVEACQGPDRALDAAICRLTRYTSEQPDGTWLDTFEGGYRHTINPPALTASVDAALALIGRVLPGWLVSIDAFSVKGWQACLLKPDGKFLVAEDLEVYGRAPTPALALCAALLAAMIGEEVKPSPPSTVTP